MRPWPIAPRACLITPAWGSGRDATTVAYTLRETISVTQQTPPRQERMVGQRQVMKRIGRPEDIGYAAAFLAGDEASFIIGPQLFVDGDLTAQL